MLSPKRRIFTRYECNGHNPLALEQTKETSLPHICYHCTTVNNSYISTHPLPPSVSLSSSLPVNPFSLTLKTQVKKSRKKLPIFIISPFLSVPPSNLVFMSSFLLLSIRYGYEYACVCVSFDSNLAPFVSDA